MAKKKNNNLGVWILAIVLVFALFKGGGISMSFYENRECFVSDRMAGCEGSGTTYIIDHFKDSSWAGYLTCTAWMKVHDCVPQNCNYLDGGYCDGYDVSDMMSRDCENDQDCWDVFGHTGYYCYAGTCEFTTNHNGLGERIDIDNETGTVIIDSNFNFDIWAENNQNVLVVLGIVMFIWFATFIFQEPKVFMTRR